MGDSGRFKAAICRRKKTYYLGTFNTEAEAADAYQIALSHERNGTLKTHIAQVRERLGLDNSSQKSSVTSKGVSRNKAGRFMARISHHYKQYRLGTFDSEGEASEAYQVALAHRKNGTLESHMVQIQEKRQLYHLGVFDPEVDAEASKAYQVALALRAKGILDNVLPRLEEEVVNVKQEVDTSLSVPSRFSSNNAAKTLVAMKLWEGTAQTNEESEDQMLPSVSIK